MRLVQLAANLVTERGGESQATEASHMFGSQAGGTGSRTSAIADHEASSANRAGQGMRRHPTLSELKRVLAKHGKFRGVLGLLGRD